MVPLPFHLRLPSWLRRCRNSCLPFVACFSCVCLLLAACGKKNSASQESQPTGPRLKWKCNTRDTSLSHPALSPDGTIYVGAYRSILAVSPEGKLLWQTKLGGVLTPVLSDDGAIYLSLRPGLIFGASRDGQLDWRPGYGLIGFAAPPALGPDTTLYYQNTVGDINAFQPKISDKELWSLETFRKANLGSSPVLPGSARVGVISTDATPLVTRAGSIILPRQSFLDSISPSGSHEWDLELTSGHLGQAALSNDGIIYVGDNEGVLFAADSSGYKKWRFDSTGSVVGSPVIDQEGVVYFTTGNAVFALNPDGNLRWRSAAPSKSGFLTAPTLAADGTLYVGAEAALVALHPDGTQKWSLHLPSPSSSPSIGPDGTIYFACGSWVCAVEDSGSPLMPSAWPKQFHDQANTSSAQHGTS